MHKWQLATVALLLVAGCAAGPGSDWARPDAAPAGFWAGLWHGALLLVALFVSFFTDDVSLYEVHNSGALYNIAFVLGVLVVYGGSASATSGGRRRERKIRAKLERCVEDEKDFQELGEKIERRIKEKLRRWLAED